MPITANLIVMIWVECGLDRIHCQLSAKVLKSALHNLEICFSQYKFSIEFYELIYCDAVNQYN